MRKLLLGVVAAFLIPVSALAADWKEGQHYKVLDDPLSDAPEVKELFSFWCPHCYTFEPVAQALKAKLPKNVNFERIHVNFMRFATPELQEELTKAHLSSIALKQEEKMVKAIFEYIHKQRASISDVDDIRKIFQVQGISADKFDKTMKSFAVRAMFNKNQQAVEAYKRDVTGTPAFIVNGKYYALSESVRSMDEFIELVLYLTEKKD